MWVSKHVFALKICFLRQNTLLKLSNLNKGGSGLLRELHTQSRRSYEAQTIIVVLRRIPRSTNEVYHSADQEGLGVIEADETDTSRHNRK